MTTRVTPPSAEMRSTMAAAAQRRFRGLAGSQLPQSPVMRGAPGDEPQPRMVKRSVSATRSGASPAGRGILREQPEEIVGGHASAISSTLDADRFGENRRGVRDIGRLVALAAMRHRREIGRVGLDQQPVVRHVGGDRAQFLGILEGQDAGEGDVAAELDADSGELRGRRKSNAG